MIIRQNSVDTKFYYSRFKDLKSWIISVISIEDFCYEEINIVFTTDEYLLELNKKYLNHDYYTDVLSFDYSTGRSISGDIFISVDRVKENSVTYNVDYADEMDRVILHGILHLIGYGDSLPEERIIMKRMEDEYLNLRYNTF